MPEPLADAKVLALLRFNTPTISNALELVSERSRLEGFNREETRDFMPHLGPMAGYAVTAEYVASRPAHDEEDRTDDLLRAIAASPKPVVVVIRDVDAPDGIVGAPWGECFSSICRALGAAGTITDGALRDYDEMVRVGFKALARRMCVSHAYGHMVAVGGPVEVFGTTIRPGELIHADQHGFITIPPDAVDHLAEAALAMDRREIEHIIAPTRRPGYTVERFLASRAAFRRASQEWQPGAGACEW